MINVRSSIVSKLNEPLSIKQNKNKKTDSKELKQTNNLTNKKID